MADAPVEQYGNTTTYNMDTVLRANILASQYFQQSAARLESWQEVVDEIYYKVEDVEPWMSGNARGPSTAFNLLYRLCQLKPSAVELRALLDHSDSPYIRAVGFLYLRYVCNPRALWEWCGRYVRDPEEFTPSPGSLGRQVTVGDFVRDILLDQYYFETLFPRIPKPVLDDITARLASMGLPTTPKGNAGQGGADRRGLEEGGRRPASVKASLSVAIGQRAPNRPGGREAGRGLGADVATTKGTTASRRPASPDRAAHADRRHDWERARERDDRRDREDRREREAGRSRERDDHDKWREREREGHREDQRGREAVRSRERDARRERDAGRSRERDEGRKRERQRDDARPRHGDGRPRHGDVDRGGRRSLSRSRSPGASRGAGNVFRDRAAPAGAGRCRDAY